VLKGPRMEKEAFEALFFFFFEMPFPWPYFASWSQGPDFHS